MLLPSSSIYNIYKYLPSCWLWHKPQRNIIIRSTKFFCRFAPKVWSPCHHQGWRMRSDFFFRRTVNSTVKVYQRTFFGSSQKNLPPKVTRELYVWTYNGIQNKVCSSFYYCTFKEKNIIYLLSSSTYVPSYKGCS